MRFFTLFILAFISFNCYSQHLINSTVNDINHVLASKRFIDSKDKYEDVKGTPYVSDDFVMAKISPGEKIYLVKYNAYEDIMEVKLNDGKTIVLDNKNMDYVITPKNSTYPYISTKEKGKNNLGYFIELLKEDKISLYKKQEKKLSPKREALNPYDKEKPAAFSKTKASYYVKFEGNDAVEKMPTKQKAFLALFSNDQNSLKKYLSKNKLKINREEDLVKIFSYLNGLENK